MVSLGFTVFYSAKTFGSKSNSSRWVTVPCPICRKRIRLPAHGTDFCQTFKHSHPLSPTQQPHEALESSSCPAAESPRSSLQSSDKSRARNSFIRRVPSKSTAASCAHVSWSRWDLCWAKCEGYPYWPGVVVELREEDGLACVAFYDSSVGTAEAQWFSTQEDSIRPYASNRQQ